MILDLIAPLRDPLRLFTGFFIVCGAWSISKLFWMLVYEIRKKDDGEKYLRYGKRRAP